jgi:hypothetical protein
LQDISYYYPQGYVSLTIKPVNSDFDSAKDYFATVIIETDDWFDDLYSLGDNHDFDSGRLEPSVLYTYSINQRFPVPISLANIARSTSK